MNNFKLLMSKLRLSWRNFGLLLLTLMIVRILFLVIIYIFNPNIQNNPTSKSSTVNTLPQPITTFPNTQKTPPQWTVFAQTKVKQTPKLVISDQVVNSLPPVPKGEEVLVSYSVTVPQVTPQPTLSPKIVVNSNPQPKTTPKKNPVTVKPQTKPKPTPTTVKKQSNMGVNPVKSNQNQNAIAKPSPTPNPPVQLVTQEFPGYPQFPKYQPSQTTSISVNPSETENIPDKVSILQTPDSLDAVVNFYNQALAETGYTFTLVIDEVETKIYQVSKGEEKLFLHLFTQPQKPEVIMVLSPEQLTRQVFKL